MSAIHPAATRAYLALPYAYSLAQELSASERQPLHQRKREPLAAAVLAAVHAVGYAVPTVQHWRDLADAANLSETLLGMGDMLYMPPGTGLPIRVHGAFVSDDEVHRVVKHLQSLGEPNYIEGILEGGTLEEGNAEGVPAGEGGGESDALYDQAVAVVLKNRKASISLVQRHLRIGYNRAARLIEQMEQSGLVSPMQSNGNRDILVPATTAE